MNEEYKIWKKNTPFLYGERLIDDWLIGEEIDFESDGERSVVGLLSHSQPLFNLLDPPF